MSRQAQQINAKAARLPTRPDVETNPPGVMDILMKKKVISAVFSADEQKKWSATFLEIFRPR
jgi:hypothetical protein